MDALRLPESLRRELKEPAGPVYTDATALLADAGRPVVAVGDVVTAHLLSAVDGGAARPPSVALVDGRTKRRVLPDRKRVDPDRFDRTVRVENSPGALSEALLSALLGALERARNAGATTLIVVDGEEDLAAVPAVAVTPDGGAVVYGQPDEGMVLVGVDGERRARMVDLLARMDGDVAGAFELLGIDPAGSAAGAEAGVGAEDEDSR